MELINFNPIKFLNKDFKSEKDLVRYICDNISLFCTQCLGVKYKSHKLEFPVQNIGRYPKKVDILIETIEGNFIIVECKNPKYACEVTNAIGQILSYSNLIEKNKNIKPIKLIIVSNIFDYDAVEVIKKYNLPIQLIGIDKEHHLLHDISHLN